jgi:hypothetical protein
MKPKLKLIVITLVLSSLTSCAPSFTPKTLEGAKCKKECAQGQQLCRSSPYNCDQGYSHCITSCIDLDRIISK